MIYVATLQNRDMLRGLIQESRKNYKIPDTLKVSNNSRLRETDWHSRESIQKTAQDYAAAAILSPSIYAYRSDSLTGMVLVSHRSAN
jgi:hypothetical protein